MLDALEICTDAVAPQAAAAALAIRREFPALSIHVTAATDADKTAGIRRMGPWITVDTAGWLAPRFDPTTFDALFDSGDALAGDLSLRIVDRAAAFDDLILAAVQILIRCQRFQDGRNCHSATPMFGEVLDHFRALHDLSKPLVAADYQHALDTWRWVLRLNANACLAVQIAALFHDIERLATESDVRIEQHAADYAAFKDAHAMTGGRMTKQILAYSELDSDTIDRVADLVATHERPQGDLDKRLLNEADALSFFSLNVCGFIAYYGLRHAEKKVAYTLARLGPRGWAELARLRHRADVAALIVRCAPMRTWRDTLERLS